MGNRLLELLMERSVRRGTFTLASGATSDLFVDCKQTALLAEGHVLMGKALFDAIENLSPRPIAVAGVELGGCPLASAVAVASFQVGRPLDAIYVRKGEKDHGSRRQLEGDTHLADGAPIAVVEDVVTTGGSTLKAVTKLRARGLNPVGVVALLDRSEGGAEAIEAAGLQFSSLFTRADVTGD